MWTNYPTLEIMDEALRALEVIVFGQHCWNSLGQIRSFGELGMPCHVIWIRHDMFTPRDSRYITSFRSFTSFEDGFAHLLSTYDDPGKKYLISTDSDRVVSWLDQHYDELKDRFYFFNAGSQGRLSSFMAKDQQIQLAEQFGLRVPQTRIVKKGDLPQGLDYPVFTKSLNSFSFGWKSNAFICRNEGELLEAYEQIKDENILLQEFIEKDNEVAVQGLSYHDGQDVYMPIQGEYLRLEEGRFGTWKRNETYRLGEDLRAKIQHIMRHIGFNGVFEIEFLRDRKGQLYFLEINFRHTQYNHALTQMGVNFGYLFAVSQVIGKIDVDNIVIKSPSVTMNDYVEYDMYIKTGRMSLLKWIGDIRKTDSFYCYDKNDKRYLFRMIGYLTRDKLRLIMKKLRK